MTFIQYQGSFHLYNSYMWGGAHFFRQFVHKTYSFSLTVFNSQLKLFQSLSALKCLFSYKLKTSHMNTLTFSYDEFHGKPFSPQ